MAEKLLGADFEIHSGGSDLIFPHHENEIAQTEAARGVPLARIWMHNGMVRTDAEKMSKSVGNIFQLGEAIDTLRRRGVARVSHRRPLPPADRVLSPTRWSRRAARVERLRNFLAEAPDGGERDPFVAERREEFLDALAADFNTPKAWAALFELVAEGNRRPCPARARRWLELLPLLGLESLLEAGDGPDAEAEGLLAERERARAERDFEAADRIRDQLAELGWQVRDAPEGARLVRRG